MYKLTENFLAKAEELGHDTDNFFASDAMTHKTQEIPFDHPDSKYMFEPSAEKPFLATPGAIEMYREKIQEFLGSLQKKALENNGLDYMQVFEDPSKPEALWIIENDDGGAITALLPSEY